MQYVLWKPVLYDKSAYTIYMSNAKRKRCTNIIINHQASTSWTYQSCNIIYRTTEWTWNKHEPLQARTPCPWLLHWTSAGDWPPWACHSSLLTWRRGPPIGKPGTPVALGQRRPTQHTGGGQSGLEKDTVQYTICTILSQTADTVTKSLCHTSVSTGTNYSICSHMNSFSKHLILTLET